MKAGQNIDSETSSFIRSYTTQSERQLILSNDKYLSYSLIEKVLGGKRPLTESSIKSLLPILKKAKKNFNSHVKDTELKFSKDKQFIQSL